jgi:hypothetical protein
LEFQDEKATYVSSEARLPTLPARMKVRAARCPGAVPEQVRAEHALQKEARVVPSLSTLPQRAPCIPCFRAGRVLQVLQGQNHLGEKNIFLVQFLLIR